MSIDYQPESWWAWIEHLPKRNKNLRRVVQTLLDSKGGMTCDEVEIATGMSHQSCSATISHASRRGLLIKSGLRRPTRTGSLAMVYVLPNTAPEEATHGSDNDATRTLEKIERSKTTSGQGQGDHHRLTQQGLDDPPRPTPESDSQYRKATDLYRGTRMRKDSDGGLDNRTPLFG